MRWWEEHDIGYVLGLARNPRLVCALGAQMQETRSVHRRTAKAARRFREFTYRTRKSWSRRRRVVGKAEHLSKGANPRFVVTNLSPRKTAARRSYEKFYCARGEMENRIKGSARLTGDSVAGESPAGRRRPATTSTPSHGPFIREGRG